jgi:hypothetical protein
MRRHKSWPVQQSASESVFTEGTNGTRPDMRSDRLRVVLTVLAIFGWIPGAVALAYGASPMAALTIRPRDFSPESSFIDRLLQRSGEDFPESLPVEDHSDWVYAPNDSARQNIVRCLTAPTGCRFASQPVVERAYACVPDRQDVCNAPEIRVSVCRLYPEWTVDEDGMPICKEHFAMPAWLHFTNRYGHPSAVTLARNCRESLARRCEWRPRHAVDSDGWN